MKPALILVVWLFTGVALAQDAPFTEAEVREFIQRQAAGDLDAYFSVGAAMLRGDRLERDVAGGIARLNHAAERGHPRSLLMLASWYDHNRETARARSYLDRALATDDPVVHFEVARMLEDGLLADVIPKLDDRMQRRVRSLELAATKGLPEAMSALGWYYRGLDVAKAVHWYEQAAMNGQGDALDGLSELLLDHPDRMDASIARLRAHDATAAAWVRFRIGTGYEQEGDAGMSRAAMMQYELIMNDGGVNERLRAVSQLRFARLVVALGNTDQRAEAVGFLEGAAKAGWFQAQCFFGIEHGEGGMLPTDPAAVERWRKELESKLSDDQIATVCEEMYGD